MKTMKDFIEAFDEKGNRFTKTVTVKDGFCQEEDKYGYYGKVISFGWPCEYYINSLLKDYPLDHNLCIDAGGRNHYGSPVYISKENINKILEEYNQDDR